MNKSKKPLAMLSTAAVAGLIAAAITTPVSAKATKIDVTGKDGKFYDYNLDALKASAVSAAINGTTDKGAALYNNFIATKASVAGFYDDVKGAYVDYATVQDAAVQAAIKQQAFVLDTFTSATGTATSTTINGVSTVVADASGNITVTPGTTTGLSVSSVNANNATLNGATGISVRPTIAVKFAGTVDSTKVTNSNIVLATATGTTVTANVTFDSTTNTATVTLPTGVALSASTSYTLTVKKDIGISADSVSTFKTGTYLVPTIATPIEGADVAGNTVTLVFNEALDMNTFNTTNVKLYNVTEGVYEPIVIAANGSNGIVVTATNGLNGRNESFKLTINKNALALSGDTLSDAYTLNFVDSAAATVGAGSLLGGGLVDGQTNVYGKITSSLGNQAFRYNATFNQDMDATTINKTNVLLREKSTGTLADYDVAYDNNSRIVTITPKSDLKESTQYELVFKKEIKNALGIQMSTTTDDIRTFTTADLTRPTIASVTPATGTTGVALNPTFKITFSEPVNPATLVRAIPGGSDFDSDGAGVSPANSATVMLKDAAGNIVNINAAGWTLTADPTSNNTVFNLVAPTGALAVNTTYTLSIKGANAVAAGVVNVADVSARANTLQNRCDVTFTTGNGDSVAPTVSSVTDGTNTLTSGVKNIVAATTTLNVKLSKNITAASAVVAGNITLTDLSTGQTFNVPAGAIAATNPGTIGNIAINLNVASAAGTTLSGDTKYRLTVNNITDNSLNLNKLASAYTFDFTTQNATTTLNPLAGGATLVAASSGSYVFTADAAADGVCGLGDTITDLQNATGVLVNSPIVVQFNDNVKNLTTDNIKLTKKSDGSVVSGTITVNTASDGFTFTPAANLANDTAYVLTIGTGVTDDVDNPLTTAITREFRTVAAAANPVVTFSGVSTSAFDRNNIDAAITLTFNGALATAGGATGADNSANYTLWIDADGSGTVNNAEGGSVVTVRPVVDTTNNKVTLYPNVALTANSNYKLLVTPTVTVGGAALSTGTSYVLGTSNAVSFYTKAAADMTGNQNNLGIQTATYNASTRVLTLTFDRPVDPTTASAVTANVPNNFTVNGGVLNILGTPAISADGLTVSMVLNATNGAIAPGVTTIAPGAGLKFVDTTGANGVFGVTAITVQ